MKTALTGIVFILGSLASHANHTCPHQITPNFYTCSGDGIKATYSYVAVPGQALLAIDSISNNNPTQHTDYIQQFDTPMGMMFSLPVSQVSDLYQTEYVWVIPPINLAPNNYYEGEVAFNTVVFLQKSRTTIAGPSYVIGPQKEILETYQVSCVADYTN